MDLESEINFKLIYIFEKLCGLLRFGVPFTEEMSKQISSTDFSRKPESNCLLLQPNV